MKRLLIISPNFPPVNSPDSARVRASLGYYQQHGWEPRVLAFAPDNTAQSLEPELTELLPPAILVDRVDAWPLGWTAWCGLRNQGWRGWRRMRRAGNRIIAQWQPDLILFSTTVFSAFYHGPYWLRRWGIPYVLDLQDPWFNDHYQRHPEQKPPGGWKYRFASAIARHGERTVYPYTAGFISVSTGYFSDLDQRFPDRQNVPRLHLPFVSDERDWTYAAQHPLPDTLDTGCIHIVATGRGGSDMHPSLDFLAQALAAATPSLSQQPIVHLLGTAYTNRERPCPQYEDVISRWQGQLEIEETPWRIGYLESLRWTQHAQVNLVLGSVDHRYSPSKLQATARSGRPLLVVSEAGTELEKLITSLPSAHFMTVADSTRPSPAQVSALVAFLRAASAAPAVVPDNLPSANEAAQKQCTFFNDITDRD